MSRARTLLSLTVMQVLLMPLFGPLHLRWPALNTVTMRDLLAHFSPDQAFTTALGSTELAGELWQDTFELALPLSLVPWLGSRNIPVSGVREEPRDETAAADFRRYAEEMPALQEQLRGWLQLEARLGDLLGQSLTPARLNSEVLPLLRDLHAALLEAAGDGPATGWLQERSEIMAQRIVAAAGSGRVAVLAPAEEVPAFEAAFRDLPVQLTEPATTLPPTDEARTRSLLDHALLAAGEEANPLLEGKLAGLELAEAGYHRAGLLLGRGEYQEALRVLEHVANGDFSEPYFLPGFLLARLGQLRDAAGDRTGAVKAYRAVLALSYVPAEARAAAREHLAEPFVPGGQSG